MVKDNSSTSYTLVQSTNTFNMFKDHYYYISRIYLGFRSIDGASLILKIIPSGNADFSDTNGFDLLTNSFGFQNNNTCDEAINTVDCKFGNFSINKERFRFQSGFCMNVNNHCSSATTGDSASSTNANTYESGIFKFTGNTGSYKLLIGSKFNSYDESGGVLPRYYTDGYMLIDISVALQLDEAKAKILFDNQGVPNGYRIGAGKIDKVIDGRYIENQKTLPTSELGLW